MWSALPLRTQTFVVVALTALILLSLQGVWDFFSGQQTTPIRYISLTVTILTVPVVGFANWIWRPLWRRFPRLGSAIFPDLNGKWEGTVQTTWKDPETGKVPGPIDATVWIRQTLFTITLKQRTKESDSWSTRVMTEANKDADRYRLWYFYENRPKAEVSERSGQHEGAAWLEVSLDDDPDRLAGQYYTARQTTGDLDLRRVSKEMPTRPRRR